MTRTNRVIGWSTRSYGCEVAKGQRSGVEKEVVCRWKLQKVSLGLYGGGA